jgi:two-component sensor histidine kinase
MLTGGPDRSLDHRLFNLMIFLIILITIWGAFNNALHLPPYILIPYMIALGLAVVTYSLSRRRLQFSEKMIYPLLALSMPVLGIIFFINSGSTGPIVIFFLAYFHTFIILSNNKQQYTIVLLLFAGVPTLYVVESLFPGLAIPYSGNNIRFWDSLLTFLVSALMLASSTILYKQNYNHERRNLAQKNIELLSRNEIMREQKQMLEQKTSHLEIALDELENKNKTIHILMKELNHRVGNNLQLVYSLLNMQESEIPDLTARQSIGQAKNRIVTISLLHQKLYRSEQPRDIDLPAYIRELCGYLVQDSTHPVDLKFSFDPPNFRSDLNASIHIGLIINEIVSNALKHAWLPDHIDRRLTLNAAVENDNRLEMSLADNLTVNNNAGGVVEIAMTLP